MILSAPRLNNAPRLRVAMRLFVHHVEASHSSRPETEVFIVSIFGSAALVNHDAAHNDKQQAATDRSMACVDMLMSSAATSSAPPSQSESHECGVIAYCKPCRRIRVLSQLARWAV